MLVPMACASPRVHRLAALGTTRRLEVRSTCGDAAPSPGRPAGTLATIGGAAAASRLTRAAGAGRRGREAELLGGGVAGGDWRRLGDGGHVVAHGVERAAHGERLCCLRLWRSALARAALAVAALGAVVLGRVLERQARAGAARPPAGRAGLR